MSYEEELVILKRLVNAAVSVINEKDELFDTLKYLMGEIGHKEYMLEGMKKAADKAND